MEVTKLLAIFLLLQLSFASAFQNRIIGGHECNETAHPWLVLISDSNGPYCSGILLNQDWVITAAHCYVSSGMQLKFGVHNKQVPRVGEQQRVCAEAKCYIDPTGADATNCPEPSDVDCHHTTDCPTFADDIMLIKLNASVNYNENVAPLNLPTAAPPVGTQCKVMGWGSINASVETYPAVPYCVCIDILNNQVCQAAYPWWDVTDKMLCAGDLEGGKDSCRGDSGGPLICGGELQGIVSFGGFPCAQPLEPGVYAKVYSYLAWIESNIEESISETY